MIFPRMLLWILWKKINRRIFRDKNSIEDEVWKRLFHNLHEMIQSKQWGERDKDLMEVEACIAAGWGLGREVC